ncbi:MAG: PRC-barrel domain-containing protein [Alphaproteobacteria bacterium]|nr:PRC-barrel domain-containing protein [Alphaproteobacteria bacterium]
MKKSMDAKRFGALVVLPLFIGAAPLAATAQETLQTPDQQMNAPADLRPDAELRGSPRPDGERTPDAVLAPDAVQPADRATPEQAATDPGAGRPEELIGKPVMAADGKSVGTVAAIKSDHAGKLVSVHIETGGVFGFGAKLREVPVSEFIRTPQGIELRLASNEIEQLGEVEPPKG